MISHPNSLSTDRSASSDQTILRDETGNNAFIAETLADTNFECCQCGYFGAIRTTDEYQYGKVLETVGCPRCSRAVCSSCTFVEERVRVIHPITKILIIVNANKQLQKSYIKIFCCCGKAELVSAKDAETTKSMGRRLSFTFSRSPVRSESGSVVDMSTDRCSGCNSGHKTCDNCVGLECGSSYEQWGELINKGSRTQRALSIVSSLKIGRKLSNASDAPPTTPTSEIRDNARFLIAQMDPNARHHIPAPHFPGNSATATPWDFEAPPVPVFQPSGYGKFREELEGDFDHRSVSPIEGPKRGRSLYRRPVSPPDP
jgi:hypothetical protein